MDVAHSLEAERVVVVLNQHTTHAPTADAKRLAATLEMYHTPQHGSRLNGAKRELAVPQRQGPSWRLGDRAAMEQEAAAWPARRYADAAAVRRPFTSVDARTKVHRRSPILHG